jgi:sugar diacid utilization regulator
MCIVHNQTVCTVDEALTSAALSRLKRVGASGGGREIRQVWLADSLSALEHAPPASFVLLTAAASAEVDDYRLDVALRWASLHGVPAVAAFADGVWVPSPTSANIAGQADIALVSVPQDMELTSLLLTLSREIEGGAAQALGRAALALDFVAIAEPRATEPAPLLAAAGTALGISLAFVPDPPPSTPTASPPGSPTLTASVRVAGEMRGSVVASGADGELAIAARLALPAVAAAVARVVEAAERAADIPVRSRGELLSMLLLSERVLDEGLLAWARQAGLRIDGWHVVIQIEFDGLAADDTLAADELRRFELLEAAGRTALQAARASNGTWNVARLGRSLALVRTTPANPGPQSGRHAVRVGIGALDAVATRFAALRSRAGVGAAHEGLIGLRASAAEARIALSRASSDRRADQVVAFDAVGVQRMLMEWYASDAAREAVRVQLAPLEELGGNKAEAAIQTLKVYLDEHCSIARTAAALHLHRNAVAYRLQRISELAGIDLDDPDQRLALQLACRARLLP